MPNIEEKTAIFCDALMAEARNGNFEVVGKSVVALIEYAAYEIARTGNTPLAIGIFQASNHVEESFRRCRDAGTERTQATTSLNLVASPDPAP